jgi:hypothetical protein
LADPQDWLVHAERAAADAVRQFKPGRSPAAAVHAVLERVVLTEPIPEISARASGSAASSATPHPHTGRLIEEAIKKTNEAHAKALGQAGVPPDVLELLQSWVEVTVDARIVQRHLQLRRAIEDVQEGVAQREEQDSSADPAQALSASELGQALGGLSDETVRVRERAGELFSVLRPGRKRGREYPAFQAWSGIAGKPLAKVLAALGSTGGTVAYGFFTSPNDLLGGLTPVEALIGKLTNPRNLEPEVQRLLSDDTVERLKAVEHAARAYAATLAG